MRPTKKTCTHQPGNVYCGKHYASPTPAPNDQLRIDGSILDKQQDLLGRYINGLYSAAMAHEKAGEKAKAEKLHEECQLVEGISELLLETQKRLKNIGDVVEMRRCA